MGEEEVPLEPGDTKLYGTKFGIIQIKKKKINFSMLFRVIL